VVSGDDVDGIGKLLQAFGQPAVVFGFAVLGEVAGNEEKVEIEGSEAIENGFEDGYGNLDEVEAVGTVPNGVRKGDV
jgi:hypothetical protein